MVMSLCMQGYQFGESNHTVYLLDALRSLDPQLLSNDWFATRTLQYHVAFGKMSEILLRFDVLEEGFLAGYLLLLLAWHVAWFRLVHVLGGTRMTYLLSVLLFFVLAGGTSLGMYQFLQDACFLPSNIANVALLWGLYFWISGKRLWSGAWIGIAGMMHLNHALVGGFLWIAMLAWEWLVRRREAGTLRTEVAGKPHFATALFRSFIPDRNTLYGSLLALGLSAANVLLALSVRHEAQGPRMPLDAWVDLYVRLRHPHHYDPSTWPLALWICFILPICGAFVAWRRMRHTPQWARAGRLFFILAALQVIALLGAGIWYVSETLVQFSLYRFSIYLKLFGSVGAAYLCYNAGVLKRSHLRTALLLLPILVIVGGVAIVMMQHFRLVAPVAGFVWGHRGGIGLMLILMIALLVYELIYARMQRVGQYLLHGGGILALIVIVAVSWNRWLGVHFVPSDDAQYLALCRWVRANTPVDSLFLVPPHEQAFRLHARRAIVINFKGVAQLSSELPPWETRITNILGMTDLRELRRPFNQTLKDIERRYAARPTAALIAVAGQYHADYLVSMRRLDIERNPIVVFGTYFLYDVHGNE